ncbi:hypothetical protein Ahy_B04g071037 [Arachis hypogaea]|uniref:Uncharacterized protein n=1 Tax=Arachis hypogaea TaxID=3818 RepID=A0A444ZJX3_ARAHY|nr:hypothetical protein Ahy_B04g071037 [Arachis hypogaea]
MGRRGGRKGEGSSPSPPLFFFAVAVQQHQNQSQFRLQMSAVNQSFRDQGMKAMQTAQSTLDPFGLLGLLSVIRMSDPDLTSLALGIDLTTL